ncbi:N-6 DNA methylase [Hymenobacter sp. DH14]|uniref:site-specific DNA-methyltransferase (adenine-specific) n=1 Tax=Hymenobacter cyanobacteriorum TaxID=2926463 RepID=A0A9X1VF44_9BACT|nr:class I SAM-dependent DNA methyltransferase [Hymenobacter cyanobacteriorum]MCI1188029.1 N-6 DNA methylase [Hymenobacter cyanobacteriorum]
MTNEQLDELRKRLWQAATRLRSDADIPLNKFDRPVLGLLFLRFADNRFAAIEDKLRAELKAQETTRVQRTEAQIALALCGLYLPPEARYDRLVTLEDDANFAEAIHDAMKAIETHKPELDGMLPKDDYAQLASTGKRKTLLKDLLRMFADIPKDATGDVFGMVYEYFLSEFALAQDGEYFTPTSVVKYMVEVLEPYRGTLYDPACGSGGMFVQSASFVERRRHERHTDEDEDLDLYVYGSEKNEETVKLARMNLAVHGLRGEVLHANAYFDDPFEDKFGEFDFVMANPPFNVKDVSLAAIEDNPRFNRFGLPRNKTKATKTTKKGSAEAADSEGERIPNGNYLWITMFIAALKREGRAALVMANSASDVGNSEYEIRRKLVLRGLVSQMTTLSSNMFLTVTLPASLWFFDRSRERDIADDQYDDKALLDADLPVLFVDARNVYRRVSRSQREFTQEQVLNVATITRLHKGERVRMVALVDEYLENTFAHLPGITQALREADAAVKTLAQQTMDALANLMLTTEEKDALHAPALVPHHAVLADGVHGTLPTSLATAESEAEKAMNAYFAWRRSTWPAGFETRSLMPDEITAANRAQHIAREALDVLATTILEHRRHLERTFRAAETLLGHAIEHLRSPVKAAPTLPRPSVLRPALTKLVEHSNTQQTKDPEFLPKSSLYYLAQVRWLHERFPEATYQNVVGLCYSASLQEIEKQDFSLNSGRYVGVDPDEDDLTEEEFQQQLHAWHQELRELTDKAHGLEQTIEMNLIALLENAE